MRRLAGIVLVCALGGAALFFGVAAGDSGEYRIRAVFDNANQVTKGEQVRVAGVTVGVIESLEVTDDNKAALTLRIDNPAYADFRQDAHCIIRPQSLIGEQFVDCTPTRPHAPGADPSPPLEVISSGPGKGDRLMPVGNTSSPVGPDLINNIMRVPQRQRFALILNEFGVALAGNGQELNSVIRRANPALMETNKVLTILAGQNRQLADLADKSATALEPIARDRAHVQGAIRNMTTVAAASAEKSAAMQENFKRLPAFLQQLTPTMNELGSFSQAFGNALEPLQGHEAAINSVVANLPQMSAYSITALNTLGNPVATTGSSVLTNPDVYATLGKTKTLAEGLKPTAAGLGSLFNSLLKTGGWEYLMQTLWTQSYANNGFNKYGHYLRGELMLYPVSACATTSQGRGSTYGSCSANFDGGNSPSGSIAAATARIAGVGTAAASIADSLSGTAVVVHPTGWPDFKPTKDDLRKIAAKKAPKAAKPKPEIKPDAKPKPKPKPKPGKGGSGGSKPPTTTTTTTTPTTTQTTAASGGGSK